MRKIISLLFAFSATGGFATGFAIETIFSNGQTPTNNIEGEESDGINKNAGQESDVEGSLNFGHGYEEQLTSADGSFNLGLNYDQGDDGIDRGLGWTFSTSGGATDVSGVGSGPSLSYNEGFDISATSACSGISGFEGYSTLAFDGPRNAYSIGGLNGEVSHFNLMTCSRNSQGGFGFNDDNKVWTNIAYDSSNQIIYALSPSTGRLYRMYYTREYADYSWYWASNRVGSSSAYSVSGNTKTWSDFRIHNGWGYAVSKGEGIVVKVNLVTGAFTRIGTWNMDSFAPTADRSKEDWNNLSVFSDTEIYAMSSFTGYIFKINAQTGTRTYMYNLHAGTGYYWRAIDFDLNSRRLYALRSDGTIISNILGETSRKEEFTLNAEGASSSSSSSGGLVSGKNSSRTTVNRPNTKTFYSKLNFVTRDEIYLTELNSWSQTTTTTTRTCKTVYYGKDNMYSRQECTDSSKSTQLSGKYVKINKININKKQYI